MRFRLTFLLACALIICTFYSLETVLAETARPFVYESRGKRDPFTPLVRGERRGYTNLEDVETVDDLLLEGILWDSTGDSIVVLNGMVLKEGDTVDSVQILRIAPKKVFLKIEGVEYELNLSETQTYGTK